MVQGTPCLGPVTHAGCGAICPAYRRGCYGCFGPMETPNMAALAAEWHALGASPRDMQRAFSTFNAAAEAFRKESRSPWRLRPSRSTIWRGSRARAPSTSPSPMAG